MRISYGWVQGSRYNACTGKYCIICPGGRKKSEFKSVFFSSRMTGDLESADVFLPRENHHDQRAAEAQNEDHSDPESDETPLDKVAIGTQNEEHNDQELANDVSWETLPMLRETAF
jgi:hypothetical protein